MIPRTLHLEPCAPRTDLAPGAWCLPGTTAEEWLEEITRWQLVDESRLRLFVMPASLQSRHPAGLFVILAPGDTPRVHPAALAFTRMGRSLFIPLDAVLLPALSTAEADALNPYPAALVMHPGLGTVGFEPSDELHLGDLVIHPPERVDTWTAPLAGLPIVPRLHSVLVKAPALDDLFGDESQDIGSDPAPEFDDPGSGKPDGTKPGLPARLVEGVTFPLLWLAQKLMQSLPHTGDRRNFLNDFEDWVNKKLGGLGNNLSEARKRALQKLIEELKNNPEEGLKHALPLAGAGQHRGSAPPSANLGNRTPNFDLGRLGGGRSLDAWNVSPDYQQELRRHYMELANREVQLGRHRRAAYIYAELLGDLSTAAIVLKNGGHFAEAALIYRDHLHRPLEAAECFASGGQIAEAVKLYEEGQRWDMLAALYRKMNDEEKAVAAYRHWINDLVQADDLRQAANLLIKELGERDEALQLLEGAWPTSRQAVKCLEQALEWRGAAGEHAAAASLVESLPHHKDATRLNDLLGLFGTLQSKYPDRTVRALAEDLGRREIARLLPTVPDIQRRNLMRLLDGLSPTDALLARDSQRHADAHRAKPRKKIPLTVSGNSAPLPDADAVALTAILTQVLPWRDKTARILAAASSHDVICVLAYGHKAARLVALHGDVRLAKSHELMEWNLPLDIWSAVCPPLLAASRQDSRFLIHLPQSPESLPQKASSAQSAAGSRSVLGTPSWLTDPLWGAAYDANGFLWVLRSTRMGWRLSQFSAKGTLVADRTLEMLDGLEPPDAPFPMVATATHVAVAIGERLLLVGATASNGHLTEEITYGDKILSLMAAPAWSSPRVAVVSGDSVHILWLGGSRPHSMLVSDGLEQPRAVFTNDGALHLVAGAGGMIVVANHTGKIQRWQFELPTRAVAIVPCADLWTFATIDEASVLTLWRYEGRSLQQRPGS